MKILENRGICIGLMLVLVVCGFLLGGYKGLAGAYQKASDVFFLGEDGDGVCDYYGSGYGCGPRAGHCA